MAQGQPVTLAIGKDEYGEAMKKDATTAGDNVHYYEDESTGNGTCGVCVVGGERYLNAIFLLLIATRLNTLRSLRTGL